MAWAEVPSFPSMMARILENLFVEPLLQVQMLLKSSARVDPLQRASPLRGFEIGLMMAYHLMSLIELNMAAKEPVLMQASN